MLETRISIPVAILEDATWAEKILTNALQTAKVSRFDKFQTWSYDGALHLRFYYRPERASRMFLLDILERVEDILQIEILDSWIQRDIPPVE